MGRIHQKKWRAFILLGFVILGCGREPLSTQRQSETPPAPKVVVEREEAKKTQPLPPEVKIKLKKDGKESYSWELNGSDVDQILKVNERLKKALEGSPSR